MYTQMLIEIVFPETINHGINCNNLVSLRNEAKQGVAQSGGEAVFKAELKNALMELWFLKTEREEPVQSFCFICST